MKATCRAPVNIAFIKYWGKKDEKLRLPTNSSISMNLDKVFTITTVEFSSKYRKDSFVMKDESVSRNEIDRVIKHLDLIRKRSGVSLKARVVSKNNFPKSTGLSSSSSAFSALTVAACKALNLKLSEKELSILARLGSGSACRSVPDGFVEWKFGKTSSASYAYSLFSPEHWKLYDLIAIVSLVKKTVSSTGGHKLVKTSPFFEKRLGDLSAKIRLFKSYLKDKKFSDFGELCEKEALNMHAVMITSSPSLLFWSEGTLKLMKMIQAWRDDGLEAYFTVNTGQDIHILVLEKDLARLRNRLKKLRFIKRVIVNKSGLGARIIDEHLF